MEEHSFQQSRFKSLISYRALCELDSQLVASQKQPYPLTVGAYFPESKGANLLTKLVLWKLRHDGHYCYRNNSQGTARKTKDGRILFVPGSKYAKGQADIAAIIKGRSVFIEVKAGKDRLSGAQEKFRSGVEQSGGLYWAVRSYDEFLNHYNSTNYEK